MKPAIIREWLVERVALGEAPPNVELTEPEKARLAALFAENEAIVSRYPPAGVSEEVTRRWKRENGRARTIRFFMVLAPSVAAALVVFAIAPVPGPDRRGASDVRLKGTSLVIHRKTERGAELLHEGQVARPGDRLQLSYRLDRRSFGVLLSIDGRGTVSLHLPEELFGPAPLLEAGRGNLPFSYELDDAPGFERFILATSDQRFEVRDIVDKAAILAKGPAEEAAYAPLHLEEHFAQTSFLLRKRTL